MIVDVDDFVGVKSFRAKGKRLTTWHVDKIAELEAVFTDEPDDDADEVSTDGSSIGEVPMDAEPDSQGQSVIEFDENVPPQ